MQVVPVYCRSCACFYLESLLIVTEGNVLCECGGIARALPGRYFSFADEPLFDAIVSSLQVADVSSLRAPELAKVLDGFENLAPGQGLAKLIELEPALGVIALIATGDARTLRTAEAMLSALLLAVGATRSPSGIIPRSAAAPTASGRGAK